MKVINIGNIAEAYICDDLPATGIVIEATPDELERLPNLTYKEVAISATPRNCDVGTAAEQAERYMNFCHNYPKCTGCPCVGRIQYHKCEFAWAQLPYEEGAK